MKKTVFLAVCAAMLGLPSCAQKNGPAPQAEEAAAAKDSAGFTVKALPLAVTSGILQAIEDGYKGSVTLIDVWATWCPPCRRAMAEIDSIKPGYMEKGVKFVYVTGETSPEKDWNEMIPGIRGDHYRLTADQWETLMKEQGIPGIPAYKALNKDGSEAFSNLTGGGYPGNEAVRGILDAALEK